MEHSKGSDIVTFVIRYSSTMILSVTRCDNASSLTRNYIKSSRIGLNMPALQFTLATCNCTRTKMEIDKAVETYNPETVKISVISIENRAHSNPVLNELRIDDRI